MFGSLAAKLKGDRGSMYVDADEDDEGPEPGPAPQLNVARYGMGGDDEEDETANVQVVQAPVVQAPPPVIAVEEEYVEDDPTLNVIRIVKATYSYDAQEDSEMTFEAGDSIAVYSFTPERWGKGRNIRTKQRGEFPCNRTNINEPEVKKGSVNRGLPGGTSSMGSGASPATQRLEVNKADVVGSPQVQRLSFFDNLNQDIAYREAKSRENSPALSRAHSPGRQHGIAQTVMQNQHQQHLQQQQQQQQHQQQQQPPVLLSPEQNQAPHRPPSPGRRQVPPPPAGARQMPPPPGGRRLPPPPAGRGGRPSGPTITRIVASEEEYALSERGTE